MSGRIAPRPRKEGELRISGEMTLTEAIRARLTPADAGVLIGRYGERQARRESSPFTDPELTSWIVAASNARLLMGSYRYAAKRLDGDSVKRRTTNGDAPHYGEVIADRAAEYARTGNMSLFFDIFNFIRIEMALRTHPAAHFNEEDR